MNLLIYSGVVLSAILCLFLFGWHNHKRLLAQQHMDLDLWKSVYLAAVPVVSDDEAARAMATRAVIAFREMEY